MGTLLCTRHTVYMISGSSHNASLCHHGVETQGVEAAGGPGGVAAVPEVLELLLGLVEHLDALQVLLLQLLELQGQRRTHHRGRVYSGETHSQEVQEWGRREELCV